MDNVAIVKRAFDAIAVRDFAHLEAVCSRDLVVQNAVTGLASDSDRYHGRRALVRYLADADRTWDLLELRSRTFHSFSAGRVMVAGTMRTELGDVTNEVAAAWLWSLVGGAIIYVRVLPTTMADQIPSSARAGTRA
jgi:ketosteroid isomerase-like protein